MSYLERTALCPYFLYDNDRKIKCEGALIDCKDKEMFVDVGYRHCAGNYKNCMLKKLLDEYYERKSD